MPDADDDPIALALAAGKSYPQAAADAGVSPATVFRRMRNPAFREQVAAIRRRVTEQAVGLLANAFVTAVERLVELVRVGDSEAVRLRAAVAVAELLRKYWADLDLSERMRRMEERLGIVGGPCPVPEPPAA